jgi:prepilin-type N-terminal cleavage/methylation domain-containing protein
MKLSSNRRSVAARTRPGFTLVELLIVMTIIAVLAALTISASMRFISVAEVRTAETRVHKIHDAFDKHWKAVLAKANQEPYETIPSTIVNLGKDSSNNIDPHRVRVIYVKLRLKQEFPMSFDEILNPKLGGLPALPTYVKALAGKSVTTGTPEQQNSGCLLLALSQARSGIVTNMEDFGAESTRNFNEGTTSNAATVIKGFVDSWSQPIVFTRWPTNAEVNALNPAQSGSQTRFADPQDPTGTLLDPAWFGSSSRGNFETLCHPISPNPTAQPNVRQAYYTVPVVWSFGPDKKHGMNITHMANPSSADNDNIFSIRLRLGGS